MHFPEAAPPLGPDDVWLMLIREADTVRAYYSTRPPLWLPLGGEGNNTHTFNDSFGGQVFAGLAVTSHEEGRVATAVFDNVQVALDYVTDILPAGDAWIRVHSPDLKEYEAPILNNIRRPEVSDGDSRWRYVRNTSFRKAIETVGSLAMDVLSLWLLGKIRLFGEKRD